MAGAVIIGETFFPTFPIRYKTWAALRTVFGRAIEGTFDEFEPMTPGLDCILKSAADGSGLIRMDKYKIYINSNVYAFLIDPVNFRTNPTPPPPTIVDYDIILNWWDYTISPQATLVPVEVQTQLTGQTMTTFLGQTFTINSTMFTTPGGRQRVLTGVGGPGSYPGRVVSVGKLTPVT